MIKRSVVILFLETWGFIYALYIDEKCFSTSPCHRHRLKCNDGNSNRIIAINAAKFGFKTSTCAIEGCEFSCCKEEVGDCFEPFSINHTLQKLLYDRCEFQEECSLDDSYRTRGCRGGRSTYSRIEYECLEESFILKTTGSLHQKNVSVMFKGSDAGFPDTGITCSIQTSGLLRITNYYTILALDRSEDDQARSKTNFFNDADCTPGNKIYFRTTDGTMFLCHKEGEFFNTEPRDIKEPNINLNLVINRLDDTDVMWLGFLAPQAGGSVLVDCTRLHESVAPTISSKATTATADTTLGIVDTRNTYTAVYIGVGVGVSLLVICIPLVILCIIVKRRSKAKKVRIFKYSEVAVDDQDEAGHYAAADEDPSRNRSTEISHQNTALKVQNSDDGYTYVDQEYLRKPNSTTTSSGVKFQPTHQADAPSKVSVVELHSPDSNLYNHIDDQKPGNSVSNENQDRLYAVVNKAKKISKPKNEEYTEPELKHEGDNSNLQTDNCDLEDDYNHLSALTSKSRNLEVKTPSIVEDTYSHI